MASPRCLCVLLLVLQTLSAVAHSQAPVTLFQVPGATYTIPYSINAPGTIMGAYYLPGDLRRSRAFVRAGTGTITTFDGPGSVNGTYPEGINFSGTIVGYYQQSDLVAHGFFRASDGTITTIDVPGADDTQPWSINDAGAVTGSYASGGRTHGFVRSADGRYTTFDTPSGTSTVPYSINSVGAVAGYYEDDHGSHGFVRAADGSFSTFDAPGRDTVGVGINSLALVTGTYGVGFTFHGFLRRADGSVVAFDVPGAVDGTIPVSINAAGAIAGFYQTPAPHGFVRSPDGAFILFDVPGSMTTAAFGVNAAGALTGTYSADGTTNRGFVVNLSICGPTICRMP